MICDGSTMREHAVLDPRAPTVAGMSPSTTLDRDARLMKDAFTRCTNSAYDRAREGYAHNVFKRLKEDRLRLGHHIMVLSRDAFDGMAPREIVEEPARTWLAIVDGWFRERDGAEQLDLSVLIRRETMSQARADIAETEVVLSGSVKALADALEAVAAHRADAETLEAAMRAKLVRLVA